jgi:hypothetical protein
MVDLQQRWAILVGDQQVPGQRMHDDAFGVESQPKRSCRLGRKPVERTAALAEDECPEDLEVRDGAARRIDIDLELVDPRFVGQGSAAGTAVRQRPPFVAPCVVVEVREEAETTVIDERAAGRIEPGAFDDQRAGECGLGMDCRGQR